MTKYWTPGSISARAVQGRSGTVGTYSNRPREARQRFSTSGLATATPIRKMRRRAGRYDSGRRQPTNRRFVVSATLVGSVVSSPMVRRFRPPTT